MVGKINFNLAEIGWKKHQNLVEIVWKITPTWPILVKNHRKWVKNAFVKSSKSAQKFTKIWQKLVWKMN